MNTTTKVSSILTHMRITQALGNKENKEVAKIE